MSTRDPRASAPLEGVRVLDLSRVLAGPYAGRILSDLGAEVIKVEPPDGDMMRLIAPKRDRGMSGTFVSWNAGKLNLCLDLGKPGAAEIGLDLVRACDAIVENFRPGVADRLGVGWDAVHRANPRAVMLSINGYGADSSWRDRSAFAPTIHAVSGVMRWQAEQSGNPIAPPADAAADMITGLHGTVALLAALRVAETTGVGQHIEVALFDALLATYSEVPYALLDPPESPQTHRVYDAGPHGWLLIAGSPQHVWRNLADAFADLEDPAPPGCDIPTKARLRLDAIEGWLASQESIEALVASLDRARLACARVEGLREALTGELARERELLVHVDDRRGGTRPVVRMPYRFSKSSAQVKGPAARRGEHNAHVLTRVLGYDAARIRELVEAGILSAAEPDER